MKWAHKKGGPIISEFGGKENKISELFGIAMQLAQKLKNQAKEIENPHNLANGHIFVLMHLHGEPNCKASDIAKMLGITSGAATGLTDKLVSLGLIDRQRPEEDRRVVLLSLSEKGKEVVKELRDQRMKWFANLFGLLDEQNLNHMTDALKQLLLLLDKQSN